MYLGQEESVQSGSIDINLRTLATLFSGFLYDKAHFKCKPAGLTQK